MTAREHSSETFAFVKSVPAQEPTCGIDYDPLQPTTLHTSDIHLKSIEHHLDRAAGLSRFLASYAYLVTCSGGADAVEGDGRDRHAQLVALDILAEHVTAANHLFHRDRYIARSGPDGHWFHKNYSVIPGSDTDIVDKAKAAAARAEAVSESPFDPAGKERPRGPR